MPDGRQSVEPELAAVTFPCATSDVDLSAEPAPERWLLGLARLVEGREGRVAGEELADGEFALRDERVSVGLAQQLGQVLVCLGLRPVEHFRVILAFPARVAS